MIRPFRCWIYCVLTLLALFSASSSATPPPLVDLRDVSPLRDWFQRQNGSVRLILLLSPTCSTCLQGYADAGRIISNTGDARLKVAAVWLPIGPQDNRKAAEAASHLVDGRITHFWDPYRAAGETWQSVLKLKGAAWDVYLLYGRDAVWNVPDLDPPSPAFWMHQLKEVPQAPQLNAQQLESKIRALLPQ